MRIGSTAAPEHVKFTPCPWPKFDGAVIVDIRHVPPEIERRARETHLGLKHKVEFLDQPSRPGFRPDRNAPTVRRQELSLDAHEAYRLELASYAMGDIRAREPGESVEHYLVDDEAAAAVWKLLTKAQREVVGELRGGQDLKLDGLLKDNEALRRWKLETDPSLMAFVESEALRLGDEHTGAEQGKG